MAEEKDLLPKYFFTYLSQKIFTQIIIRDTYVCKYVYAMNVYANQNTCILVY